MERVTGIGGVFFRSQRPRRARRLVRRAPGRPLEDGYVVFPESRNTVWSPFSADTSYWPADKHGMVNFTVTDLDAMLAQLRAAGIEVEERVEEHEYGRFGWATDPEGNRFELWQPS